MERSVKTTVNTRAPITLFYHNVPDKSVTTTVLVSHSMVTLIVVFAVVGVREVTLSGRTHKVGSDCLGYKVGVDVQVGVPVIPSNIQQR